MPIKDKSLADYRQAIFMASDASCAATDVIDAADEYSPHDRSLFIERVIQLLRDKQQAV